MALAKFGWLSLAAIVASAGGNRPPRFEEFASQRYVGIVAMPVFMKVEAGNQPFPDGDLRCIGEDEVLRRRFFSGKRPNFAGHWIIEKCTCGTGCSYPFMWDARTGEVFRDFPVHAMFSGPMYWDSNGLIHRVNSRLLVVEAFDNENGQEGWRRYYEWDGREFRLRYRVRLRFEGRRSSWSGQIQVGNPSQRIKSFLSESLAAHRAQNSIELQGRFGRNVLIFRKSDRKADHPPVLAVARETKVMTVQI